MTVVIRPTRAADFEAFSGRLPEYRCKALTVEDGDRILGIGGVMFLPNGIGLAFVDRGEDVPVLPVAMHKAATRIMREARAAGWRLVATCDPEEPAASRWLERLGFTATGTFAEGRKVYAWSSSA